MTDWINKPLNLGFQASRYAGQWVSVNTLGWCKVVLYDPAQLKMLVLDPRTNDHWVIEEFEIDSTSHTDPRVQSLASGIQPDEGQVQS